MFRTSGRKSIIANGRSERSSYIGKNIEPRASDQIQGVLKLGANGVHSGSSFLGLTSVLHPGSNALHGQDEGVLQPRRVLAGRVQLHELRGRLVPVHDLLGQVGAQRDMVVWVADALHCVGLADVHGGDVCVTEAETLLQVEITFKKIPVPSNLKSKNEVQYIVKCWSGS